MAGTTAPTGPVARTTTASASPSPTRGVYGCYSSTVTNLAILASDPTNPRIDLVCLSVEDQDYSGTSNEGVLQVVTGTPAASPVAPSAPSSSCVLAHVSVAANATSITAADITDVRPFALALSSCPPTRVRNTSPGGTVGTSGTWSYPGTDFDALGLYDHTNNLYRCPVAGYFRVTLYMTASSSASGLQAHEQHNAISGLGGSNPISNGIRPPARVYPDPRHSGECLGLVHADSYLLNEWPVG